MAPPKRLRIMYDDIAISASMLPEVSPDNADQVVCKNCSPRKTELMEVCSLVQFGFERDRFYTVFVCKTCHQQWAVPYYVSHAPEGVA